MHLPFVSPSPAHNRVSPLSSPLLAGAAHGEHWSEDIDATTLVQAARGAVYPAEFRLREELDLLSRQWPSILGSLFVLVYLILMVFLNFAFYRYEPPVDGRRLKDMGYEIIPELPPGYEAVVDFPLSCMYVFVGIMLFGTLRACVPCRRGSYKDQISEIPYVVNIVRRFFLSFAAGHVLRALTYLVTTIPGGNDKCLDKELLTRVRPTLAQCFYHTASVKSNCGDLMFSGHLLLCTLLLCLVNRYVGSVMSWSALGRRLYLALGICLTIWEFFMIIAARHHYTSDCIVAFYFTPTLWYSFEYYNPHDQVPDRIHIARAIIERNKLRLSAMSNEAIAFV
jgi:hypothetical protein